MDSIQKLIDTKEKLSQGGGEQKVEAQHNLNKLTARERVETVIDEGSFIEIGAHLGKNGCGVITGYGTINGRLVYVFSQDYTSNGGSINLANSNKICSIMDMALKMGAPIIEIYDSIGAELSEGIEVLGAYGKIIKKNAELSGAVPQIAVIAGACTGAAAISAAMSDFTIMVESSGELYINSPDKIAEVEENYVNINMYGDAVSGSKNGTAQLTAKDDKEALEVVRRLIDYLPSNTLELSLNTNADELSVTEGALDEISKEKNYDIYEILNYIGDKDSLIEINGNHMKEVLTGLMKLNGITIGVMATDKIENNEGICIKAVDKLTRLAKLCSSYNLPILSIVDTKGFRVALDEERNGLALSASKLLFTLSEAKVPKVSLIIGDAFGSAYITLASKEAAFDITYAWPSARISIGEPEAVIKSIYKEEILSSDKPKDKEKEIIEKYRDKFTNPYSAAETGIIDDIILPSESRMRLFAVIDMLQSKRVVSYPKKHGSILI